MIVPLLQLKSSSDQRRRMDPKYDRDLFERHLGCRARTCLIIDVLRRLLPVGGWKSILRYRLRRWAVFPRIVAVWGSRRRGAVCGTGEPTQSPYRSRIQICPFDENFRPGKRYSLILMLDVLEHLEDAVGGLRHALELLEPDGIFVATVPAFPKQP
jgi:hypothetical protein